MQNSKPKVSCYECNTISNLKICSQDTAICLKCYEQQVQEAKYYKSQRVKDPQINQIDDTIYLGNQDAASTQSILSQRQITAICVCGTNLQTPFIENPKFSYKLYQIDDFTLQPIKHFFEGHYDWVQEMKSQGRKILIHCAAGISRSASFTIAYLMRERKMGFQSALQFVRSKRKCIHPNSGFRAQLIEYQNELIQKKVIMLD